MSFSKVLLDNKFLLVLIKYNKPTLDGNRVIQLPVKHNRIILYLMNDNKVAACDHRVLAITNCSEKFSKKLPKATCESTESIIVVDRGIVIIN